MPNEILASHVDVAVISTNGKEEKSAPPPSDLGVTTLVKAETSLMLWLVFLAIGGGILALYYARIRYLPDIEWSASLIYLGVATIVGGGLGILFAMSLVLPGFIWAEFLLADPRLEEKFCYDTQTKELCVGTIIRYLGKPFGIVLLISHAALVVGQYVESLWWVFLVYTVVSLILLRIFWWRVHRNFKRLARRKTGEKTGHRKTAHKELSRWNLKCTSWFFLSLVLSLISVLTIYLLSRPKDLLSFAVLTMICTAAVLISNHVVALRYRANYRQAIVASLVATGFLLLVADWFSPLSLRLMGFYGLGAERKVELVFTAEGSHLISDLGLTPCHTRSVCGVEILSKLGDEYYIAVDGRTVMLPKKVVASYHSFDPRMTKK